MSFISLEVRATLPPFPHCNKKWTNGRSSRSDFKRNEGPRTLGRTFIGLDSRIPCNPLCTRERLPLRSAVSIQTKLPHETRLRDRGPRWHSVTCLAVINIHDTRLWVRGPRCHFVECLKRTAPRTIDFQSSVFRVAGYSRIAPFIDVSL